MTYIVGALMASSLILAVYAYYKNKAHAAESKSKLNDMIAHEQATLIIFDKNIHDLEAKDFNDKYDALSYLSGKPNSHN